MNKFAQLLYGKVIYIYETDLKKEELSTIFSPTAFWVDVTGQDVKVGYIATFNSQGGLLLSAPETTGEVQDYEYIDPNTLDLAEAVLLLSDEVEKMKGGTM